MWKGIQVPTGIHDKTSVRPLMEGHSDTVMDAFGKWKSGSSETPLGDAKGIVVHDEKGRTRYAASR